MTSHSRDVSPGTRITDTESNRITRILSAMLREKQECGFFVVEKYKMSFCHVFVSRVGPEYRSVNLKSGLVTAFHNCLYEFRTVYFYSDRFTLAMDRFIILKKP